jgi:hypothetical protein
LNAYLESFRWNQETQSYEGGKPSLKTLRLAFVALKRLDAFDAATPRGKGNEKAIAKVKKFNAEGDHQLLNFKPPKDEVQQKAWAIAISEPSTKEGLVRIGYFLRNAKKAAKKVQAEGTMPEGMTVVDRSVLEWGRSSDMEKQYLSDNPIEIEAFTKNPEAWKERFLEEHPDKKEAILEAREKPQEMWNLIHKYREMVLER